MRSLRRFEAIIALLLAAPLTAADSYREFTVTYISAEHVYIDGGTEDGLRVGDRLTLALDAAVPVIEVVFVSGHSASCRRLPDTPVPAVGAKVRLLASTVETEGAMPIEPAPPDYNPPAPMPSPAPLGAAPVPTRISGAVSLGFYHFADAAPADLNFSQTNARLRLKAEHLGKDHLTLVVRTRGRYDSRQRAYSDLGRDDWENRLWELSISYDDPDALMSVFAGRILPRQLSVSGYLDGALAEWRPTSSLRFGVLGGQQPDWLYRTEVPSITRLGGYLSYGNWRSRRSALQQTFGVVAETRSGTTNRTFLVAQGEIHGGRWGISHSAEIDINTGWREERAGESISLSRAYLHTYWQLSQPLRLGLSYDNLRRYWTYEYHSVSDSLFDDRSRQGARARIDWAASPGWRLSFGGGLRDNPDDTNPIISYSTSIRRSRLLHRNVSASAYLSGFDGDRENGINYAIQLDALTNRLGQIHIRFGRYQYAVQNIDANRSSWSIETGLDTDFAQRYFLGALVQYNSGDDIDGWRLQTDLGYRF